MKSVDCLTIGQANHSSGGLSPIVGVILVWHNNNNINNKFIQTESTCIHKINKILRLHEKCILHRSLVRTGRPTGRTQYLWLPVMDRALKHPRLPGHLRRGVPVTSPCLRRVSTKHRRVIVGLVEFLQGAIPLVSCSAHLSKYKA